MKKYRINEIFGPTLQGEGSCIGQLVYFIRFAGCNQICEFCDTKHNNYIEMSDSDIVESIPKNCALVVTGGEPLLQIDDNLFSKLKNKVKEIHLETNGTLDTNLAFDHISMSPKVIRDKIKLKKFHDLKIVYPFMKPDDWDDLNVNKFIQPLQKDDKINLDECLEILSRYPHWRLSPQLQRLLCLK